MTGALVLTRPRSNTADKPTGPAPMITASVSITPAPGSCPARASTLIRSLFSALLELLCRHANHEPVELGRNLDLAAEPALIAHIEGEIEHVLLHLGRLAGLLAPGFVHVNVARRARACTTALGLDSRHAVVLGRLHEGHSRLALDHLLAIVGLNEGDLDHAARRTPPQGDRRLPRAHDGTHRKGGPFAPHQ